MGVPVAENEKVYDEKIAPLMTQIITICDEHKMPYHCSFMFRADELCTSHNEHGSDSIIMFMLYVASMCFGNLDRFIMSMQKHAEKKGHGSMFLRLFENQAEERKRRDEESNAAERGKSDALAGVAARETGVHYMASYVSSRIVYGRGDEGVRPS